MSHYAEVKGATVLRVIVADQSFIANMPGRWVQCSYNTSGGEHTKGGQPLRMNYPGPGWTYDEVADAFIPPKPDPIEGYGEWTLDAETCLWEPPAGYDFLLTAGEPK